MLLDGKVALVTGSSRGIGAAIAKGFAREGCTVVVNYNKSKNDAEKVLSEVRMYSKFSLAKKFDVSKKEEVKDSINEIIKKLDKIDILVNNAGITMSCSFLELEERDLEEVLATNLKGSFYCTQMVVGHMIKRKSGKIINVTSMSQFSPFYNSVHYAMSKGALGMLTKCIALELGKYNIQVNSLIPGIIKTEIVNAYKDESLMKRMEKIIPLRRIGVPNDIVGAAIFLASSMSDYITGTEILVDGGFCLFENKNPME